MGDPREAGEDRAVRPDGGDDRQGDAESPREEDRRARRPRGGRRRGGGRERRRRRSSEGTDVDVDSDVVAFSVATFVAFGLGTTIAVFLFGALLPRGAGEAFDVVAGGAAASLVVGIFLAPLLAVVTGLTAPRGQSADGGAVAVSTGAGAAAGFVVMVVVEFLLVLVLSGGGGGGPGGPGGGLGQILLPALGFTVGVGLTGAAAGYIGAEF